mmetsp:Transcript_32023/g.96336  ORF Transcript_32023/g.96336 Transcript_32023/m.96336 type:complete len:662 (+) Transcript_32023:689-2674(+)
MIDRSPANDDINGWSYGLSWWMLSLRTQDGATFQEPRMSLVRRRKWLRHLRAAVGGNLPAAFTEGTKSCPLAQSPVLWPLQKVPGHPQLVDSPIETGIYLQAQPLDISAITPTSYRLAPEPPPEARLVLVTHALQTIRLAEEMMQDADPLYMRRWFHTAVVYFEVLCSLGELTPELDYQRHRVRRLARLCSHLYENCTIEHDAQTQITDIYDMHSDHVLGHGSYGSVCLATHKASTNEYACKVLSINRIGPQHVDKLHAEISSMRQLDHPNIVRLREVFFAHRKIFLVMELCTGGELFDLVNTSIEHRTEQFATQSLTQMFSAVRYLHGNGVIHRDLKLENWLFESRASSHLKLIDFGLAKHVLANERVHGAVGSMYYVAPEVLQHSYDLRCDLWSLGVIAYMLVSGAPPFWGRDDGDIRQKIVTGCWEFPPQFFGHVSPLAKDFIARLLTPTPELRMTSTEALGHPWLSSHTSRPSQSLPEWQRVELLCTLRDFAVFPLLHKVVLFVVAFNSSPDKIVSARNVFRQIDLDRSGTISFDEFSRATSDLPSLWFKSHHDLEGLTILDMFKAIDMSRTTEINFTEFLAATTWRRMAVNDVKSVFDILDVSGTGMLDASSIKALVGIDFDDDEVNRLMRDADEDRDGFISYSDFLRLWQACTPV